MTKRFVHNSFVSFRPRLRKYYYQTFNKSLFLFPGHGQARIPLPQHLKTVPQRRHRPVQLSPLQHGRLAGRNSGDRAGRQPDRGRRAHESVEEQQSSGGGVAWAEHVQFSPADVLHRPSTRVTDAAAGAAQPLIEQRTFKCLLVSVESSHGGLL